MKKRYRPFWHRINKYDQLYIQEHSEITLRQFMKKFRQPDWCNYPAALAGEMGCWSLFYRYVHDIGDCKDCCILCKER